MAPESDACSPLLRDLRAIAPAAAERQIDEVERRLSTSALRVLVVGEGKRGKATLLNPLLGRDVLPTGVVPVTAVTTTLRVDLEERVVVHHQDGPVRTLPLGLLPDLVTEHGNPANRLGLRDVEVRLAAPVLDDAEPVDTPGVGSVHEHNTAEAEAALDDMDAAVFVLTADPPISAGERALRTDADSDLRRSVTAHIVGMARGIAMTQQGTLAAAAFSEVSVADRLGQFRTTPATVERERAETAAVAVAGFRRSRPGAGRVAQLRGAHQAPGPSRPPTDPGLRRPAGGGRARPPRRAVRGRLPRRARRDPAVVPPGDGATVHRRGRPPRTGHRGRGGPAGDAVGADHPCRRGGRAAAVRVRAAPARGKLAAPVICATDTAG